MNQKNNLYQLTKKEIKDIFRLKKEDCKEIFRKDGKLRRFSKNLDLQYQTLLCLLHNNERYGSIQFPFLYGNVKNILKKCLILQKCKQEDFHYVIWKKPSKTDVFKDMYIAVYHTKYIEDYATYQFLGYLYHEKKDLDFFHFFYEQDQKNIENQLKYLASEGINYKLQYVDISDTDLLSLLFYKRYIMYYRNEIEKKYQIQYEQFQNFHQLYQYFKEVGLIHTFFQQYGPKILSYIRVFIPMIRNHPLFPGFIKKIQKTSKSFQKIDIPKLIRTYAPPHVDKRKFIKSFEMYKKIDS